MASCIKVRTGGGLLLGIGLVSLMAHGVSGHRNIILKEPDGTKNFSDCTECRYISRVADKVYVTKEKIPDNGPVMSETPIAFWGYSLELYGEEWYPSLVIHKGKNGDKETFLYYLTTENQLKEIFQKFINIEDTIHIDASRSGTSSYTNSTVGSNWSMSSATGTRNLLLKKPDGDKQFSDCGECYYISRVKGEVCVTRTEIPRIQSNNLQDLITFKPEAYEFNGAYKDRKDVYKLMLRHEGRDEIYLYQLSADRARLVTILEGVKDMAPSDGGPRQKETTFSQDEWITVWPAAISRNRSVGKMFNAQLKSKDTISELTTDHETATELSVAGKTISIDDDVRSIIIPSRKVGSTHYRFDPKDTLKVFHLLKQITVTNTNSYPVMKVTLMIDGNRFRCIGTCYEYVRVTKTIANANNAPVLRYHLVGPDYVSFTFEVDYRPPNLFEFEGTVDFKPRGTKKIQLRTARQIELAEGQQPVKL